MENGYSSDQDLFESPCKRQGKPLETATVALQHITGCKDSKVKALRTLLSGIPPPPEITNPDYNLQSLLDNWHLNQNFLWTNKTIETEHNPLGVCLNVDDSCEELERLGLTFIDRFVWNETYCWTGKAVQKNTESAKKRRKANGWSASPRTRLNYLSRRRNVFRAVSPRKTFMVPIKDDLTNLRDLRPRRALFQSPDDKQSYKTPESHRSLPRVSLEALSKTAPPAPVQTIERKKCSRSLFGCLSKTHRQKMLWAVSIALRESGVKSSDETYKNKVAWLFNRTSTAWKNRDADEDSKTSTSDTMLKLAKDLVNLKPLCESPQKKTPKKTPKESPKNNDNTWKNESRASCSTPQKKRKRQLSPSVMPLEKKDKIEPIKENRTPSKRQKKDFTPKKIG